MRAPGQERWRVPQRQRGARVGIAVEHGGQPPPRRDEFGHVFLEPRPGFAFTGAIVRASAPPPPERRPDRLHVLADPVTGLAFFEGLQRERDFACRGRLLPWGGRPRPRRPVRRGDSLKPGAPVRPVDILHPPLPVLPVQGRSRLVFPAVVLRHSPSALPMPAAGSCPSVHGLSARPRVATSASPSRPSTRTGSVARQSGAPGPGAHPDRAPVLCLLRQREAVQLLLGQGARADRRGTLPGYSGPPPLAFRVVPE